MRRQGDEAIGARAWTLGPSHAGGRCSCVVAAGWVRAERGVLPRACRPRPEDQDVHTQLVVVTWTPAGHAPTS
eukprot:6879479-Alexandrium_andersonii.AAC.1